MTIKFPTMIEWMEEVGFEKLREMYKEDEEKKDSFSNFVKTIYSEEQEMWDDEMSSVKIMSNNFDDRDVGIDDLVEETAKNIFIDIVNDTITDGIVKEKILNCDWIPDNFMLVVKVKECFMNKVLPLVEKTLFPKFDKEFME